MTVTKVRERGIIFSGESVRATMAGTKTQTRRVVNPQPIKHPGGKYEPHDPFVHRDGVTWSWMSGAVSYTEHDVRCPYGQPGDRLYVKEAWAWVDDADRSRGVLFRADAMYDRCGPWRSPVLMPHAVARITLEILSVRVERLQEITEADAIAEGMDYEWHGVPVGAVENYRTAWDAINKSRGYQWSASPWVWVREFRKLETRARLDHRATA